MRTQSAFNLLCASASPRLAALTIVLARILGGAVCLQLGRQLWQVQEGHLLSVLCMGAGVCLVLGFITRLAGWGMVIGLCVALLVSHAWTLEVVLLLVLCALLASLAAGHLFGIDALVARSRFLRRSRALQTLIGS